MTEAKDVIEGLIEGTNNDELEWKVGTDAGGYWLCKCGRLTFQVMRDGSIDVWGGIPYMSLGASLELAEVLERLKPIASPPKITREEALQLALECIYEEKA